MKTPQFTPYPAVANSTIDQQLSLGFTKQQLAQLYFGTRSWNVVFNFTGSYAGMPATTSSRAIVANAGERNETLDGQVLSPSPNNPGFITKEETVSPRALYFCEREDRYTTNSGGPSVNSGSEFTFAIGKSLFVKDGIYYPQMEVDWIDILGGGDHRVATLKTTINNGTDFSNQPISIIYAGRSGRLFYSREGNPNFSLSGTVVVTPIPW